MQRSVRLFGVALSLAVPAALSAHEAVRPVSFGLSCGLSMPTGDLGDGADASTRSVGVVANAIYDFATNGTSMVKPYVLAGLGLYNNKTLGEVENASVAGSATDVGIQVGGGMEFQLSGFAT